MNKITPIIVPCKWNVFCKPLSTILINKAPDGFLRLTPNNKLPCNVTLSAYKSFSVYPPGLSLQRYDDIVFRDVDTLLLLDCDKNFVYYNLNKIIFPNLKRIGLFSDPCEYRVLMRYDDSVEIGVTDETPKKRWWKDIDGVTKFSFSEKNNLVEHIMNGNGAIINFSKLI